ncbi:MAG: hypothetical protein Q9166_005404 [cf. Caloplaca sp. 2 TL-2023]
MAPMDGKVEPWEDLDDMVHVSDEDDGNMKDSVMQPSSYVEPGMVADIKSFYPGEKDDRGRYIVTDKRPDDLPEPEETEENGRYALVIRYNRCFDGRKNLSISSIVVQSPLLKKVLGWVLKDYPCMAPELDRLEIVSPFRPFVHRWQRLTDALYTEQDPTTKSHIRLFYDALKSDLELTLETRDDFIDHNTITFNALWMIFSPGDIIFTTRNKRQVAARLKDSYIHQDRHVDIHRLECEMIYGDGETFGWNQTWIDIQEFAGMKKINDLEVYPLRFHHNVDGITKQLVENGKAYERLLGLHHKQYQGIALDGRQPFYVDSRIIIDGKTYKCNNPDRDILLRPLYEAKEIDKAPMLQDSLDQLQPDHNVTGSSAKAKKIEPVPALTEEQLMLCGSVVKGYSLRNKRWLDFFVDNIKDIQWKENARDDVVLDEEQKDLIFSMAEGHRLNHKGLKTKGLNILICGPTGVGKTFIVESVAESLRAPLFYLTSADVDLDPKDPDLESPFSDLLEMCGKWNAILLFDEANGSLDGDRLDKNEGSEYSLLLRALESHSTAIFVTCNSAPEDYMDDRFLSRFHVSLDLPDLTSTTREQIWQKCLESHRDVTIFVDSGLLAHWQLNGREIANAVTAAKTLARHGTLDMKHLERVVPASKRPFVVDPVKEDVWGSLADPLKDRKKKAKKGVVEIIEEPARGDEGDWPWGTWGSSKPVKDKKGKKVDPESHAVAPPDVDRENDTKTVRKHRTSDWVDSDAAKPTSKTEFASPSPPPPPPAPKDSEIPRQISGTWDFGGITKDLPEAHDGWGSFGTRKTKKGKKAATKEPEIPGVAGATETAEPIPVPEIDDGWGNWGIRKDKKSKKVVAKDPEEPVPAEAVTTDVVDDGWGSFGVKKEKKSKKVAAKEPQACVPAEATTIAEPMLPPVQVDEWDFWASSKKTKKGKKKTATTTSFDFDELPAPEAPVEKEVKEHPPVEEVVPVKESPLVENVASATETVGDWKACPTCFDRGIEWDVQEGNHCQKCGTFYQRKSMNGYTAPAPQTLRCRTCASHQPVFKGLYCKRCGTLEGTRKIVCKRCAASKGCNKYKVLDIPCEICGEAQS